MPIRTGFQRRLNRDFHRNVEINIDIRMASY